MTKQEVISGLKCHAGTGGCSECPYNHMFAMSCTIHLALDALALIEGLENKNKINVTTKILQGNLFELQEGIRQLHNLSESLNEEKEND